MAISDKSRKVIVDELNLVADKMDKSQTGEEKLYYFSAAYSMVQRIFNIEYESDLIFIFFVLRETYNTINIRIQALKRGEGLVMLEEEQFSKLTQYTRELARLFNSKKDVTDILKKMALLAYTTTGNGHYLVQKGLLKF